MLEIANDGLQLRHRKAVLDILRANPRVERAVLYGSRATGNYREASDIDIALEGADLTFTDQADLLDALLDTTIPYEFDITLMHEIENDALRDHINSDGITWFTRDEPAAATP